MATAASRKSMNEPNDRDPFNNSSYGTLVDAPYIPAQPTMLDVIQFNDSVIDAYERGVAEKELPADLPLARSLVPAGTAALRDFSYVAPEIPITSRTTAPAAWSASRSARTRPSWEKSPANPTGRRKWTPSQIRRNARTSASSGRSRANTMTGRRRSWARAASSRIIIDPSKCKGCAECVTVCGDDALKMVRERRIADAGYPTRPPTV